MKNVNIEAMEEKIKNVIGLFEMGILNEHQTVKQLLYLNNVNQQREPLIILTNKLLDDIHDINPDLSQKRQDELNNIINGG